MKQAHIAELFNVKKQVDQLKSEQNLKFVEKEKEIHKLKQEFRDT